MVKFRGVFRVLGMGAGAYLACSSAWAQALPPPPPLSADNNSCGWELAGAGAALGAAYLLAPKSNPGYVNWTGLYIGGHLGCAWGDTTWSFQNNSAFSAAGGSGSFDNHGWVGGVQVGYNQQVGRWIFGVEATWSDGDVHGEAVNLLNPAPAVNSTRLTTDISSIFTLTARLGYAFDPRWMGYVKGGFASAEVEATLDRVSAVNSSRASASSRHNGWALGAGAEYLLTNNIVLGVDYTYINLGSEDHQPSCTGFPCVAPAFSIDPDNIHMLVGRISYRFGSSYDPLK